MYLLERFKFARIGKKRELVRNEAEASFKLQNPAQFYRSFAFLYRSGTPITKAFKLLGAGRKREDEKLACLKVFAYLRSGLTLSGSLLKAGFDPGVAAVVKSGEFSGNLDEAMLWYAEYSERNETLVRELKKQLFHPLITVVFSLMLACLLPPLVLKDQLELLAHNGGELPLLSQGLLLFSQFVTGPIFWLGIAGAALVAYAMKALLRLRWARVKWEEFWIKVPVIGEGLQRAAACRSLALLSLLLRTGLPITKSLELAGEVSGSLLLEEKLKKVSLGLVAGHEICESMEQIDWYLESSIGLTASGQASGKLPSMLDLAGRVEEDRFRDRLETFAQMLQPLVLISVGCIVCITILGVLGPTLNMLQAL